MPTRTADADLTSLGAAEVARRLANGEVASREITDAFLQRIAEVDPTLRAMTVVLADEARSAAAQADVLLAQCRATGQTPPSLCGVPVTVKDCFDVAGSPTTLGIRRLENDRADDDGALVARLRAAGAVVLGKTNVPQAMMLHCCDNPVYGRTLHPTDPRRGPGGSSGGEAAIVAAGGSPVGLGSDLGGSIRQPAHACGLAGLKPTTGRLTNVGSHRGLAGMNTVAIQPGPIARRVEDLDLVLSVLACPDHVPWQPDEFCLPWPDYRQVKVSEVHLAVAPTDGWFTAAEPCQRAVRESAAALRGVGAAVSEMPLPEIDRAMRLYFALVSADGLHSIRRLIGRGPVDWQIRRQGWFARLPRSVRHPTTWLLHCLGQRWLARLLAMAGATSADRYWQATAAAEAYAKTFWQKLDQQAGRTVDAVLLPPHALPALPHATALDLLPAASYCFLANLLGAPAGVVPWTTVAADEQHYRHGSRVDLVTRLARHTMHQSARLPIGVQVIARPWREDLALAVMGELEHQREGAGG